MNNLIIKSLHEYSWTRTPMYFYLFTVLSHKGAEYRKQYIAKERRKKNRNRYKN